ncbi:MAG: DNA repair exonuclease, partial [Spirochaetes bacterium]|nr:DNA repair exonuclease [Spirochaetota bacterium]
MEAFSAFEKLINYTIDPENRIDILIIAGDLFDNPKPEVPLVEKVNDLLFKVVSKKIRLFILPGNHDSYSYKNCIYRVHQFPGTVIKNSGFSLVEKFNIKGHHVFIYSGLYELKNPHNRMLRDFKITNEEGTHIGILHGTLEMKDITISDRELPFSLKEFTNSGLHYLALGHFHGYKEKMIDKEHFCLYPGSIIPRTIDEYDDKFSAVVEIKQNNAVTIEKLKFSNIKVEKRVIDVIKEDISSLQDLLSLLKKGKDPELILDLYLKGVIDFSINEPELKEILKDHYFYIRINNEAKFVDSSVIKQLSQEETIRGLFFRKLLERSEKGGKIDRKVLEQTVNLGLRDFGDTISYKESNISFVKGDHDIEID